jgi:hypothetical protein
MPKSIPRWIKVLALGLVLSAAALLINELVTSARANAPLLRAFNSWFGLLFRGTQAITYISLGGVMTLLANRLVK